MNDNHEQHQTPITPLLPDGCILRAKVAGFSFGDGDTVWSMLKAGKKLRLIRESGNKYDANAVAVYFSNTKLGYIPKKDNLPIAKIFDAGSGNSLHAYIENAYIDENKEHVVIFNILNNK